MIYDFKCNACGYEEKDRYSKTPLPRKIKCPKCGKEDFEKQIGRTNFVLAWVKRGEK